jgi:hypothetical protein
MARPRIFVSSTYYDLKHLRASLEAFIEDLGYDAVLSEKGAIAFSPDVPLDESCYREVGNADIFVLIIGGRYGSEHSAGTKAVPKSFFDRYESVTKLEYRSAVGNDIPVYIFIERAVYSEYQTFLRNDARADIAYAHVDSVNVFHLIKEIIGQSRNNVVREFDRYEDIQSWLRDQWAGLFRELLHRATDQKRMTSLESQVAGLAEVSATLRTYLEQVVQKVTPAEGPALVHSETARLEKALQQSQLLANTFVNWSVRRLELAPADVVHALMTATSFHELATLLEKHLDSSPHLEMMRSVVPSSREAFDDANVARAEVGLAAFTDEPTDELIPHKARLRRRIPKSKE